MHIIKIVLEIAGGLAVLAVIIAVLFAVALSNDQANGRNPFE